MALDRLRGLAIPFNSPGQVLTRDGPFVETIAPGALKQDPEDVFALFSHDHDKPLANRSSGNLRLDHRQDGIYFDFEPVNTAYGRDSIALVRSKTARQMSFGFFVGEDQWEERDGAIHRRILAGEYYEISLVGRPSYRATYAEVRGWEQVAVEELTRQRQLAEADVMLAQLREGEYRMECREVADEARSSLRELVQRSANRLKLKIRETRSANLGDRERQCRLVDLQLRVAETNSLLRRFQLEPIPPVEL